MAEENKTLKARCAELERLLDKAREEAKYYQQIAKDSGRGRLREIDRLSRLITERKRTEEALRKERDFNKTLIEASPTFFVAIGADGKTLMMNKAMLQALGYDSDEVIGTDYLSTFVPERDREMLSEIFRTLVKQHQPTLNENYVLTKDGRERLVEWHGRPIFKENGQFDFLFGVGIDITERKRAEEERKKLEAKLQQAQKLEAIGTLAGGIAHDFNNLLMGIQGNVSLMAMDIDPTHPHYERLKSIEKQIQSGAKLTSHLLGYARKGRYEIKPVDLNQLVEETSETFGRTRKGITIHRDLAEDLFAVEADPGQIEQVLLNLYVNAADAMHGGGDLILKTMNTTHKDMKGRLYDPKPGNYVVLTVTDTGIGMDRETMDRIFDPFFTTKEMGRGTGLGLASAYGIIKGHGGYVDVGSKKGHGTTFSVYLPASEEKVQKAVKNAEKLIKGTETILLADDEEIILKVGRELLEAMGYRVLTVRDGKEAIEVYRKNWDDIDIVILDMVMPNMDGGEAYDHLKEINPNIKVVLSSGFSIDGEASEILARGCNGFIQKPFTIKELSGKIRGILDKE
ncbi:MAG: PAS domain S-box protein [Deltaproteobacteria bacterium]|nr:PAS domain S-box protein [Deltaproteobacteria bacterium]MBW2074764.1 PAS domain S-box protein [Deltaproteobacteria bacterium]RLB80460.1 MAG: hybrid sensor histidine kinase/response regulator [Deltaproteobacteria bacterium]